MNEDGSSKRNKIKLSSVIKSDKNKDIENLTKD
jgi:hypothetical protein